MLRFSVNISMLFKEVDFLDRFERTARAGFDAVEFLWPSGVDLGELVQAKESASVKVALFNVDAGDMPAGDRGFLSDPTRRDWWRERFGVALELAGRLDCPRLNVLAGNAIAGIDREAQIDCLVDNLCWAIPQSERAGITLLLEALNLLEHPRYLFVHSAEVLAVLERIGSPTAQFQYDAYHMQRMEGNITATLRDCIERVGHIQVADSPDRHEPGTGEIDYRYVLAEIERLGYKGYIGLEYNPSGVSEDSFAWLPPDKRKSATAADLIL